jgi:hypothetical protein
LCVCGWVWVERWVCWRVDVTDGARCQAAHDATAAHSAHTTHTCVSASSILCCRRWLSAASREAVASAASRAARRLLALSSRPVVGGVLQACARGRVCRWLSGGGAEDRPARTTSSTAHTRACHTFETRHKATQLTQHKATHACHTFETRDFGCCCRLVRRSAPQRLQLSQQLGSLSLFERCDV